jgi:hypothetical protein
MAWSYKYTFKGAVTANNTMEAAISILEDGEVRVENVQIVASPEDMASMCELRVKEFVTQYGAFSQLPALGVEVVVS